MLPAGGRPAHPAELLGSAAMRRVLDTLRARFDRILIDMPPVGAARRRRDRSAMADGILMIVRAGVTQKPAIERALSGLDQRRSSASSSTTRDTPAPATYGYGHRTATSPEL